MHKNKDKKEPENEVSGTVQENEQTAGTGSPEQSAGENPPESKACCSEEELKTLQQRLNEKTKQYEDAFGMLQRTAAEFDNYKKRTAREKEALYNEALADAVAAFLPVADNLERAIGALTQEEGQSLKDGVQMVLRQMKDIMKKLGVEEIESVGMGFDPQLHNAVMHIEDESLGNNVVAEEFQKGYRLKERVIRHSMVKVAN